MIEKPTTPTDKRDDDADESEEPLRKIHISKPLQKRHIQEEETPLAGRRTPADETPLAKAQPE